MGAGPAGCATALSLARRGVTGVCLVDAGSGRRVPVGETIPPDTRPLLVRLGVWDAFRGQGHLPCLGSCSAWGSDSLGYNDFLLNPLGPGWHLDRPAFDAMLRSAAADAGVAVVAEARCVDVQPVPGGGFRLSLLRAGAVEELRAGVVVDATGSDAAVARRLGARRAATDRLLFGYGFPDAPAAAQHRLTLLEAVPEGWWYAAGLPGRRLAVAFASDAGLVRRDGLARPDEWWRAAQATRHLAPLLAGARRTGTRLVLRRVAMGILEPVAGPGWLAAGDAAATYDPLMAQGIHKALADGERAAGAIAAGATIDGYAGAAHAAFAEYLANRAYVYSLEKRWPDAEFWRRRPAYP